MEKLAAYAMQNSGFRAITGRPTVDVPPTDRDKDGYHLENTNKLVHTIANDDRMEYRYAIGIKTGDTDAAGCCLVAAAEKDGITLISIQLNDPDRYRRFSLAAKMFDWGFDNFVTIDAATLGLPVTVEMPVTGTDIISRGLVYVRESEGLIDDAKVVRAAVRDFARRPYFEWAAINNNLKNLLKDFFYDKTKRNPVILPVILEV